MAAVLLHDLIRDSRVLELGPLPAPRLPPEATLHQALQFLVRGRRGAIVVVDPELRPIGILTERDVLHRSGSDDLTRERRRKIRLEAVMSKPPVCIERRATLHQAIETMNRNRHRHLVVVDGEGRLRGLLTTNDLTQFLTDQYPQQVINLPPRLHQQFRRPDGA